MNGQEDGGAKMAAAGQALGLGAAMPGRGHIGQISKNPGGFMSHQAQRIDSNTSEIRSMTQQLNAITEMVQGPRPQQANVPHGPGDQYDPSTETGRLSNAVDVQNDALPDLGQAIHELRAALGLA